LEIRQQLRLVGRLFVFFPLILAALASLSEEVAVKLFAPQVDYRKQSNEMK
jgi:hypothetical protein